MSYDLTGTKPVRLANGRQRSALELQEEYFVRARDHADAQGWVTPAAPWRARSSYGNDPCGRSSRAIRRSSTPRSTGPSNCG